MTHYNIFTVTFVRTALAGGTLSKFENHFLCALVYSSPGGRGLLSA